MTEKANYCFEPCLEGLHREAGLGWGRFSEGVWVLDEGALWVF